MKTTIKKDKVKDKVAEIISMPFQKNGNKNHMLNCIHGTVCYSGEIPGPLPQALSNNTMA